MLFGIRRDFGLGTFGIRRRLHKTILLVGARLHSPLASFLFCFAIRRHQFCFVRHLLNLRVDDNNTLLSQINQYSLFRLQDIPRHPDTRLSEVREAFKLSLIHI